MAKPASAGITTTSVGAPGCYYWKVTDYQNNFIGWTLWTNNLEVQNWCWTLNLYNYWVIYSQPWAAWWVTTHWGWQNCGLMGHLEGWNNPPFEWGSADSVQFGAPVDINNSACNYGWIPVDGVNKVNDEVAIWVYGWGRVDYM